MVAGLASKLARTRSRCLAAQGNLHMSTWVDVMTSAGYRTARCSKVDATTLQQASFPTKEGKRVTDMTRTSNCTLQQRLDIRVNASSDVTDPMNAFEHSTATLRTLNLHQHMLHGCRSSRSERTSATHDSCYSCIPTLGLSLTLLLSKSVIVSGAGHRAPAQGLRPAILVELLRTIAALRTPRKGAAKETHAEGVRA